jgi:hypothetical protein
MNRVWKAHWFWGKYIPDDAVIGSQTYTAWNDHHENNCPASTFAQRETARMLYCIHEIWCAILRTKQ